MSNSDLGIRLIVGLGNPGAQYEKTRHNAGAWFVDYLAHHFNQTFRVESKLFASVCKLDIHGQSIWLMKPTTFMNHSGRALSAFAQFYKIPVNAILVAHDELDFPAGTTRLKFDGGHGGHNGLRDSIHALSAANFYRLRIGIGHPGRSDLVSDYVLHSPSVADKQAIEHTFDDVLHALHDLVRGDIERAFRELHSE